MNRNQKLNAEIEGHIQMSIRDRIARGESPAEAEANARREFGNEGLVFETTRDQWRWNWAGQFVSDVRYGLRGMRRNPGFTAVAVIALALGIGANSAIFSAVNAILLRPLAYRDADRLVVILNRGTGPVSTGNYFDWKEQSHSFSSMGGADYWMPDLTGGPDHGIKPEKLWALQVTPDIFPMLGVDPMLGRYFTPDENQNGRQYKAVLGHGLWQRKFGGDRNVVGKTINLDGRPYEIVGVMPSRFKFAPFWATRAELWAPRYFPNRGNGGNHLRVFARLAPGVTLEQAREEMKGITARLEQQYPGSNRNIEVAPLKERVVKQIRPALLTLLAAVGLVLLISCANVAHMLLARAASRSREMAVRVALGAGRSRMIRQFLTESLMLALAGGAAGLLLAAAGIRALVAFAPPGVPRIESVTLDGGIVAFTFLVSLATGVVFGLAPAWQASRTDPGDALKDGGRSGSGSASRTRLRSVLVVSEFALALMLLIGAGLMIRTFFALEGVDPGWRPERRLAMIVSLGGSKESAPGRRAPFYKEVVERVSALPGVEGASFTNHIPVVGDQWGYPFYVEGRPLPRPGEAPGAAYRVAFPGYLETIGLPVIRGRGIVAGDTAEALQVVVINEYMARTHWPGEDAIGKRITINNPGVAGANPRWMTIVGIVKNAVRSDWAAPPEEEVFLPYAQQADFIGRSDIYMTLVVHTAGDPSAMARAIESNIWEIDRDVTISEVITLDAVVSLATAQSRFNMSLLAAFAAVAMALSAVGIYGVMSYAVVRRRQEIGIRMALGASRGDVLGMVARQGLALALIGTLAGLAGALSLARLMSKLLYGVQPADPLTFFLVPLTLIAVGLAACLVPALRAARISPVSALRYE